jgi:hypothetical protein
LNQVKTELTNRIKELTLEKEKALEQNKVKDSTIESQADQIDELTRLRKDLEKSLKEVKKKCKKC